MLQKNGVGSGNGGFVGWTGSTKTVTIANCTSAATLTIASTGCQYYGAIASTGCQYYGAIAGNNDGGTLSGNLAIGATVPAFALNFDGSEASGIVSVSVGGGFPADPSASAPWYTLDGRRLSGKPTQRGIYIVGGRKVVVK